MKTEVSSENPGNLEVSTLGGGCFWCTEAVFNRVQGVEKVIPGYSGGNTEEPTYEQVVTGTTGHAEVVQVTFDPSIISYKGVLEIFFRTHDPTTLNRQGADVGTQYRSVVFYHSNRQRETVERIIRELNDEKIWSSPIVTMVEPFKTFYQAENYHRNYYDQHRTQPYCRLVIDPKIDKLRRGFKKRLRASKSG
jgi:methionine-S-sulfoxide reductase